MLDILRRSDGQGWMRIDPCMARTKMSWVGVVGWLDLFFFTRENSSDIILYCPCSRLKYPCASFVDRHHAAWHGLKSGAPLTRWHILSSIFAFNILRAKEVKMATKGCILVHGAVIYQRECQWFEINHFWLAFDFSSVERFAISGLGSGRRKQKASSLDCAIFFWHLETWVVEQLL